MSGVEQTPDEPPQVWFAYANSEASAAHLERLFRGAGYAKVRVKNLDDDSLWRQDEVGETDG